MGSGGGQGLGCWTCPLGDVQGAALPPPPLHAPAMGLSVQALGSLGDRPKRFLASALSRMQPPPAHSRPGGFFPVFGGSLFQAAVPCPWGWGQLCAPALAELSPPVGVFAL